MCRRLLLICIAAFLAGPISVNAEAQGGAEGASTFVSAFAQRGIVEVLEADIPGEERSVRFRKLFNEFFDIPSIARFAVGRYWRTAQTTEQERLFAAFEDVIVGTWSRRFSEYDGQTLDVQSAVPDGKNGALVESTIVGKSIDPFAVAWRLRHRSEGWKVVDVIVEGVSMALTYRQEYATIISQRGGVPGLVKELETQAATLAGQQ